MTHAAPKCPTTGASGSSWATGKPASASPGADLSGGVSYLLWERDYDGDRAVVNMSHGKGNERQRDLGREHG